MPYIDMCHIRTRRYTSLHYICHIQTCVLYMPYIDLCHIRIRTYTSLHYICHIQTCAISEPVDTPLVYIICAIYRHVPYQNPQIHQFTLYMPYVDLCHIRTRRYTKFTLYTCHIQTLCHIRTPQIHQFTLYVPFRTRTLIYAIYRHVPYQNPQIHQFTSLHYTCHIQTCAISEPVDTLVYILFAIYRHVPYQKPQIHQFTFYMPYIDMCHIRTRRYTSLHYICHIQTCAISEPVDTLVYIIYAIYRHVPYQNPQIHQFSFYLPYIDMCHIRTRRYTSLYYICHIQTCAISDPVDTLVSIIYAIYRPVPYQKPQIHWFTLYMPYIDMCHIRSRRYTSLHYICHIQTCAISEHVDTLVYITYAIYRHVPYQNPQIHQFTLYMPYIDMCHIRTRRYTSLHHICHIQTCTVSEPVVTLVYIYMPYIDTCHIRTRRYTSLHFICHIQTCAISEAVDTLVYIIYAIYRPVPYQNTQIHWFILLMPYIDMCHIRTHRYTSLHYICHIQTCAISELVDTPVYIIYAIYRPVPYQNPYIHQFTLYMPYIDMCHIRTRRYTTLHYICHIQTCAISEPVDTLVYIIRAIYRHVPYQNPQIHQFTLYVPFIDMCHIRTRSYTSLHYTCHIQTCAISEPVDTLVYILFAIYRHVPYQKPQIHQFTFYMPYIDMCHIRTRRYTSLHYMCHIQTCAISEPVDTLVFILFAIYRHVPYQNTQIHQFILHMSYIDMCHIRARRYTSFHYICHIQTCAISETLDTLVYIIYAIYRHVPYQKPQIHQFTLYMPYIDLCHIRTRRYTGLYYLCHIQTCAISEPIDTLVYIIYAIYRHVPYQNSQIHQFTLYVPYIDMCHIRTRRYTSLHYTCHLQTCAISEPVDTLVYILFAIYRHVPYQKPQIHQFTFYMPYIDMCHIRARRYTSFHYICHIQTCAISETVDTLVYIIYAIYRHVPYQKPQIHQFTLYMPYIDLCHIRTRRYTGLYYLCHIQTCAISEPIDTLVYITYAIYRPVPYQNPQIHQFTLYMTYIDMCHIRTRGYTRFHYICHIQTCAISETVDTLVYIIYAIYRHVPYQKPQIHQFTLYMPYIDLCHIRTRRYTGLYYLCHIQTCAISEPIDTLVYITYAIYRPVPYQNPQIHQFTLYMPYIDMCHIRTRGYTSLHYICHIQTCAISEPVDTLVYIIYAIYRHVPYQNPQIHQFTLYMPYIDMCHIRTRRYTCLHYICHIQTCAISEPVDPLVFILFAIYRHVPYQNTQIHQFILYMPYIDMCHIRPRRYTSFHYICHIQTCAISETVDTLVYIIYAIYRHVPYQKPQIHQFTLYMPYIDLCHIRTRRYTGLYYLCHIQTCAISEPIDTLVYIIYAIYRHVPYQNSQIHQFTSYMPYIDMYRIRTRSYTSLHLYAIYRHVPYQNTQIHQFTFYMPYIDMCHIRSRRYTSLHYICHIQTCAISEHVDTLVYITYAIYRHVPYQNPQIHQFTLYMPYIDMCHIRTRRYTSLHYICHIQTCAISEPVYTLVNIIYAIYRHVPYQNPQIHHFTLYMPYIDLCHIRTRRYTSLHYTCHIQTCAISEPVDTLVYIIRAIYRHVPYQNPQLHQFTLYVPYIDMCHIRTRRYTSLHFICHIQTCAISETVDTLVYILYAIYRHVPYQNPQIHQFTLYMPYIDMCHIRTRGYTSFHFICHIQTCAISEHVDTLVYITYVIYRHVPYQSPQIHQFPLYMPYIDLCHIRNRRYTGLHYICHIQTCAISEAVDTLVYIIYAIYRPVPYQNTQIHWFILLMPYIDMCHIRTHRYTSLHYICHIQTCAISEPVDTLVYIIYDIYRHVPYQNPWIHQFTLYMPYIDLCNFRTRRYTSLHYICHIQTCAISEPVDTLVYIIYAIYRHVPYQNPQIHQFTLYMPYIDMCHIRTRRYTSFHFICHIQTCAISEHVDTLVYIIYAIYRHVPYQTPQIHQFPLYMPYIDLCHIRNRRYTGLHYICHIQTCAISEAVDTLVYIIYAIYRPVPYQNTQIHWFILLMPYIDMCHISTHRYTSLHYICHIQTCAISELVDTPVYIIYAIYRHVPYQNPQLHQFTFICHIQTRAISEHVDTLVYILYAIYRHVPYQKPQIHQFTLYMPYIDLCHIRTRRYTGLYYLCHIQTCAISEPIDTLVYIIYAIYRHVPYQNSQIHQFTLYMPYIDLCHIRTRIYTSLHYICHIQTCAISEPVDTPLYIIYAIYRPVPYQNPQIHQFTLYVPYIDMCHIRTRRYTSLHYTCHLQTCAISEPVATLVYIIRAIYRHVPYQNPQIHQFTFYLPYIDMCHIRNRRYTSLHFICHIQTCAISEPVDTLVYIIYAIYRHVPYQNPWIHQFSFYLPYIDMCHIRTRRYTSLYYICHIQTCAISEPVDTLVSIIYAIYRPVPYQKPQIHWFTLYMPYIDMCHIRSRRYTSLHYICHIQTCAISEHVDTLVYITYAIYRHVPYQNPQIHQFTLYMPYIDLCHIRTRRYTSLHYI